MESTMSQPSDRINATALTTASINGRRRRLVLAGAATPTLAALPVFAQGFPNRPVKLVVPFAAGGPTDVMTRALAKLMAGPLGQQVIVENRPGAGGNIAAAYVASSPADGYTVLIAGQAIMAISNVLYDKPGYDPVKDFSWVGMLGSLPNVLIAHPEAVPARDMKGFIALAKTRELSYASNGNGSLSHLSTEVLAQAAGVKFVHVPYKGAAPARVDLLAGRVAFTLVSPSTAMPLIKQGSVRALAVSTPTRMPSLPDVPTLVESGFPMLDVPVWFAAVAPSGTPSGPLNALRKAFTATITTPAYKTEIDKQFGMVVNLDADAAGKMLTRERQIWGDAVRRTGAKAG
jgi:tripartite-type tricarboxylate transporter receptor subunit TctC